MQVSREQSLDDERKMMHVEETNFSSQLVATGEQQDEDAGENEDDDEKKNNNGQQEDHSQRQQQSIRFANSNVPISASSASARFSNPRALTQPADRMAQDSLVAQMRNIVEGDHRRNLAKQNENQPSAESSAAQVQPKSSSDSLNNQNDDVSKASQDSAQQNTSQNNKSRDSKRQHCARHHHYHHHHHHAHHHARRSIGEVTVQDDAHTTSTSMGTSDQKAVITTNDPSVHHQHHHHHHQHHRHNHHHHHSHHKHSGGQRHRGHHHHHHHHHGHHSSATPGARSAKQRSSLAQIEPIKTLESGADAQDDGKSSKDIGANRTNKRQGNESKSSTSSISSAPTTHVNQQEKNSSKQDHQCQQSNPSQSSRELVGEASKYPEKIDDGKMSNNEDHHQERHHHQQHRASMQDSSDITGLPHHGHHHHHHHHRCHHRHKKRLVLDLGNEQSSSISSNKVDAQKREGVENTSTTIASSGDLSVKKMSDESIEDKKKMSQDEAGSAGPLQDLTSKANIPTYCPYHESKAKHSHAHTHQHPHHHHHHHHHHHPHQHNVHSIQCQHQSKDAQTTLESNQEASAASKPPHHHHHHHRHHRHHHHHHGHHNKQRHRNRQKSVSKSREQIQIENNDTNDKLPVMGDFDSSNQARLLVEGADEEKLTSVQLVNKSLGIGNQENDSNSDHKMHLDPQDELKSSEKEALGDRANYDIVKMEMSPNSEGRLSRIADDCEQLVDSTASDSNLITSIEVIPLATNADQIQSGSEQTVVQVDGTNMKWIQQQTKQQRHDDQQQLDHDYHSQEHQLSKDVDFCAQDASGDGQVSNRDNERNEADESQKENFNSREDNADKRDKLIRQTSSSNEGSKKSHRGNIGGDNVASGGNGRSEQHIKEYPSIQSESCHQQSQPKQIIDSNVLPDRRCRLCWCCCCPCSALSNRGNLNRADVAKPSSEPSNSPANKCPSLPNVPLEEIRAWGESFDRLMKCSDGRKIFQDFLRCEYSEENILFWTACEELKAEKDSKNIAARARDIYEDYISILSSKEVSLDSRVRDIINNNIKKPTSNIFDEAQLQIYTLMHRDSYPRFINSAMYKKLAQIQPTSRKSSS